jgi:hypothetical protein
VGKRLLTGMFRSAKLVFSAVDQALGKPQERVEHTVPTTLAELENMPEEALERLVAEGRERRLRLVEQSEAKPDWRAADVHSEADASS